jgi:hypothetical protein
MSAMEGNHTTLGALRAQLDFLEQGGYRSQSNASWRQPEIFIDSPTCLNFSALHKTRSCEECLLMQFVPDERRKMLIPCHHISLTEAGDTVASTEGWADQDELERFVAEWLRKAIARLEEEIRDSAAEDSAG